MHKRRPFMNFPVLCRNAEFVLRSYHEVWPTNPQIFERHLYRPPQLVQRMVPFFLFWHHMPISSIIIAV
jgi:hypothetical protein